MERPEPWSDELRALIFSNVPDDLLNHYPAPLSFYSRLASFLNVKEENLLLTAGIDEAIKSLIALTCKAGDRVAVSWPGYAMYDVYSQIFGTTLQTISYDPDRLMSADEFISKLDNPRIVFLPNPSQPVENCFDLAGMRKIAKACDEQNILFVVDEAYHFFGAPSAIPLIDEFDNVLILRSFSKAFGAAGIRMGYVIGSENALKPLAAYRLAHESNSLSLHAATVMVEQFENYILPGILSICEGRDWLRNSFQARKIPSWGAVGNFVLAQLESHAHMRSCVDELAANGIYVKGGFPAPLDRHLLVTCGSKELMSDFFSKFMDIYEKQRLPK